MTHWADPRDVLRKADEWTPGQLACRLNKYHDWTDPTLTLLERHPGGAMTVRQLCGRNCGVGRQAQMNARGRLLTKWKPDRATSELAKKYRMVDENGRSLGRIDEDGQAEIRLLCWAGIAVVDVGDE